VCRGASTEAHHGRTQLHISIKTFANTMPQRDDTLRNAGATVQRFAFENRSTWLGRSGMIRLPALKSGWLFHGDP